MSKPNFPVPVEHVAQTLVALLKKQNKDHLVWVLQGSTPVIDYLDSSDYGGYHESWQLRFEVPVERFADIEVDLDRIQKALDRKVQSIGRGIPGHRISQVILTPQLVVPIAEVAPPPPDMDVERIYGSGKFRVFISHLSTDKLFLSELKQSLASRGVAAFLAHEDIEPTKEWQTEIELALRSMQAMVVFLAEGFIASKWTDQEVGWALGRGVLVIPVKVDINPYGFMGKLQALRGQREQASSLASLIVDLLVTNPQTSEAMRKALVNAMLHAKSFSEAQAVMGSLSRVQDYSEAEKQTLLEAVEGNRQVSRAWGVREWIETNFRRPQAFVDNDDLSF